MLQIVGKVENHYKMFRIILLFTVPICLQCVHEQKLITSVPGPVLKALQTLL